MARRWAACALAIATIADTPDLEAMTMSDDLREREPRRDQGDHPPEDGTRSDGAGTGTGTVGPAPAGGDPERIAEGPAADPEAPGGAGATAGGGYGSASDRSSSGGSGDGESAAGDDPQTAWLRDAARGDGEQTER